MNDQQTANLLEEIIQSKGSLAAASNPYPSVEVLHNFLISGNLYKKRSLSGATNTINRAKLIHDFLNKW
jgi:hypothetical protein